MPHPIPLVDWIRRLPESPDPELASFLIHAARLARDLVADSFHPDREEALNSLVHELESHPASGSRYGGRLLADIVVRAADLAVSRMGRDNFLRQWQDGALRLLPSAGLTAAGPH